MHEKSQQEIVIRRACVFAGDAQLVWLLKSTGTEDGEIFFECLWIFNAFFRVLHAVKCWALTSWLDARCCCPCLGSGEEPRRCWSWGKGVWGRTWRRASAGVHQASEHIWFFKKSHFLLEILKNGLSIFISLQKLGDADERNWKAECGETCGQIRGENQITQCRSADFLPTVTVIWTKARFCGRTSRTNTRGTNACLYTYLCVGEFTVTTSSFSQSVYLGVSPIETKLHTRWSAPQWSEGRNAVWLLRQRQHKSSASIFSHTKQRGFIVCVQQSRFYSTLKIQLV